jgi:hypothetical protein
MSEIMDFIKENYLNIAIIVVSVLFLLAIIQFKEIDLNPPKPETKLVQQVTVETFQDLEDIKLNSWDNFCDSCLGNFTELEGSCNQLTETNCNKSKCCVYNNDKCVAGDSNGPTYKTDKNGKLITIDSYYYMGTKYTT